jgi:hypothetical protein
MKTNDEIAQGIKIIKNKVSTKAESKVKGKNNFERYIEYETEIKQIFY